MVGYWCFVANAFKAIASPMLMALLKSHSGLDMNFAAGNTEVFNCTLSPEYLDWVQKMPEIDRSWMFFGLWKSLSKR